MNKEMFQHALLNEKTVERPFEDIERSVLKLRKIDGSFSDLFPEQKVFLHKALQDTVTHVLFDDLGYLRDFYFFQKDKGFAQENTTSLFEKFSPEKKSSFHGGDCIDQNLRLKEELEKNGIFSYLIGFEAQGLINDSANRYAGLRHSGLIVPFKTNNRESWYYLDPGMGIVEPLLVDDPTKSTSLSTLRAFHILRGENGKHTLQVASLKPDGSQTILFEWNSDISFEWMDPKTTGTKDIMRCQRSFRTVKRGRDGDELAGVFLYPQTENIMLKLRIDGEKEFLLEQSFDFLSFKNLKSSGAWEDFTKISTHLKQNPEKWFQELCEIIDFLPEYQSHVIIPSAREKND